ncbi:hypothetical protein [uncultured Chryseobacterium sp.]|uniref:hypothetical protein n=1 Tax=uncultured Chryseobacterium sp. TaxID=259322 RepID=UPI0025CC4D6F|nr:hypothetical protein [uncultured Chryseobacterium sp.]
MILIDYLYYQITNFYHHFEKDGTHKASGFIGVCLLLSLNMVFILLYLNHFYGIETLPSNKYVVLIYCFPIILLMGLRYWKFTSYKEIKEEIQNFSKTKKIIADILVIMYSAISFFGFIFFAIYLGSLKNTF